MTADTCSELREYLARELHDGVAGELQEMLVEIELLSRRGGAPSEIEDFRAAVRSSLAGLRQVVRELRLLPTDQLHVQAEIDRKLAGALEQRDV
jgi:signal transduction histidine kinase